MSSDTCTHSSKVTLFYSELDVASLASSLRPMSTSSKEHAVVVARIGVDRPILIGVGRVFAERARFASTIAHARGCAITGEAHRAWRGPPNATDDLEALVDAC